MPQFEIQLPELMQWLTITDAFMSTKGNKLAQLKIEANRCTISALDRDTGAKLAGRIDLETIKMGTPGVWTVPVSLAHRWLTQVAKQTTGDEIAMLSVHTNAGGDEATLSWGELSAQLRSPVIEGISSIPEGPKPPPNLTTVTFTCAEFVEAMAQISSAVSAKMTTLTGVHIQAGPNGCILEATDSYQAARVRIIEDPCGEEIISTVLDRPAIDLVAKIFKMGGTDELSVLLAPNRVWFRTDKMNLSVSCLAVQYPNLTKSLAQVSSYTRSLTIGNAQFKMALDLVGLLSSDTISVVLEPDGEMVLSVRSDLGATQVPVADSHWKYPERTELVLSKNFLLDRTTDAKCDQLIWHIPIGPGMVLLQGENREYQAWLMARQS